MKNRANYCRWEKRVRYGKTHENIKTIRPLKDGVIADFRLQNTVRELIDIPAFRKTVPPYLRMVICIPSGLLS